MLMAGSTARLFANIVFSFLLLMLWGWCATFAEGIGFVCVLLCILFTVNGLILAVQFVDLPAPVMSAGQAGLVFSKQLTNDDLLEWSEVKSLKLVSYSYQFFAMPWMSYIAVRSARKGYFKGFASLLPTSWFGYYLLPTRLLKGGGKSARQMIGILNSLREADRYDLAHGADREFMSDKSLRWNMMRNVTFPIPKGGPGEDVMAGAVKDSLMEQAGVHRDLTPEPVRQQVLASESGRQLAAKGEDWGRQLARDFKPQEEVGRAASLEGATPRPGFGRKGVLLNGQPLE